MFDFNLKPIPGTIVTPSIYNGKEMPRISSNNPFFSYSVTQDSPTSQLATKKVDNNSFIGYVNLDMDNDLIILLSGTKNYSDEMRSLGSDLFSATIPQKDLNDIGLKVIVREDNSLHVSLFDSYKNKLLLNSVFKENENTWIPEQSASNSSSLGQNPLVIGLAVALYYTVNALAINKKLSSPGKKNKGTDILSKETNCIDHDMICSIGNGRTILGVDVFRCCIEHDIALWCTKSNALVNAINFQLYMCIFSKFIDELPFWLKLILGPVFEAVGLVFSILEVIFDWLNFDELFGLTGFTDPVYPFLGGGVGWSCLCGKGGDTYCCDPDRSPEYCKRNGVPRNLCFEATCFNCYVECLRDENGDLTGKKRQVTHPKLPCCFNTPPKGSDKIDCKKNLGNNRV